MKACRAQINIGISLSGPPSLISAHAVVLQIHPNVPANRTQRAALASLFARLAAGASERLVGHFKSPHHEAITHQAFGCTNADVFACARKSPDKRAP